MVGMALITWACGHFVMKPSPIGRSSDALIVSAIKGFWFLRENAEEDFANAPTNRYITSKANCPSCQEPVGVDFWRARAQHDIDLLFYYHECFKNMYLETAVKYHMLDFSQKVHFANDGRCASAHEQFWISKTPRTQDPFFFSAMDVVLLCYYAQQIMDTAYTTEDVKKAFVHLNKARAELSSMVMPLDDLQSAVELMSTAQNKDRDGEVDRNGIKSRELVISLRKGMDFCGRMGDWRDQAMNTSSRMLRG